MKTLLCLLSSLILLVITLSGATTSEIRLGRFSSGDLSGWKEQTVGLMKNKTVYTLTRDNDRSVLMARSAKSASGQIYKINLDPKEYPLLKWSWKIDHTIKKGDEKTKEGDDFSARVYVVFPRGFFSSTRAICYVWGNKLPKGEHVVSPFTPNIITVAVDSGSELAGRWTFHQQNIHDDYRRFFGEEPPRIGAVALMTDTDNTGEAAVGYYGDITLARAHRTPDDRGKEEKDHKTKEPQQKEIRTKEQLRDGKSGGETPLPGNGAPQPPQPARPASGQGGRPDAKERPAGASNPAPAAAPLPAVVK